MTQNLGSNSNLKKLYEERQVFPRFFYRYYETCSLDQSELQRDMYELFVKFCGDKVPVVSAKSLGRYLLNVDVKIYYAYVSGNQRRWYGIKRREQPIEGVIAPEDLILWLSQKDLYDGDEDPVTVEVHRGRPRLGESAPVPLRPLQSFTKGMNWGKLYRIYRQRRVIERFKELYVVVDPDWCTPRDAVWDAFDTFCQAEKLPTCSAIRLAHELRVKTQINLDNSKDLIGIKLQVKSN